MIQIAKKNIQKKSKDPEKIITQRSINLSAIILSIMLTLFLIMTLTTKVEVETEGWCNSGFIGLDIEAYNNIQNKTCTKIQWDNTTQSFEDKPDPNMENLTCFKEDYQLKHIKLKNIDGLNCQGKAKIKMPFILSLFMGGINE